MDKKRIIVIIGLMGAGKTTIGHKLAQSLKYYFIDSDQEIEDQQHQSISDIFAVKGEKYFRDIEAKIIRDILNRDEDIVLSVGGGAFMNDITRQIIKEKALVVWLHASIEETIRRIGSKSNRPLLNKKNKRNILEELSKARYPIYREADLEFDTTNLSFEELTSNIMNKINSFKK